MDLAEAILTIRETKFYKSRLVPIGADLVGVLRRYRDQQGEKRARAPHDPFLSDHHGRPHPASDRRTRLQAREGAGRAGAADVSDVPAAPARLPPHVRDESTGQLVPRGEERAAAAAASVDVLGPSQREGNAAVLEHDGGADDAGGTCGSSSTPFQEGRMKTHEGAPLGGWVRRFLVEHLVVERNLSRNTQRSYRDTLRLLIPFAADEHKTAVDRLVVTDVSADVVRHFLRHIEERRGCGVRTRNQRLAAIHALATFVGERCPELIPWCGEVRAVPFKRYDRPGLCYLDKPEIDALLGRAGSHDRARPS